MGGPSAVDKNVTDGAPQQDVLGYDMDAAKMTVSPPANKIRELQELMEEWPAGTVSYTHLTLPTKA